MTEIKAGQVYEMQRGKIVITFTEYDLRDGFHYIMDDGTCGYLTDWFVKTLKLLATYPTWQEAIAKEFRNDRR